jgi:hypothetical protein
MYELDTAMCNRVPGGNGPAGDQRNPHRPGREQVGQPLPRNTEGLAFRRGDDLMVEQDNLIVAQNLHKFSMNSPHLCHHSCTNRCHAGSQGTRQCTVALIPISRSQGFSGNHSNGVSCGQKTKTPHLLRINPIIVGLARRCGHDLYFS